MKNLQSSQQFSNTITRFKKSTSPKRNARTAEFNIQNYNVSLLDNTLFNSSSAIALESSYRSTYNNKYFGILTSLQKLCHDRSLRIKKPIKLCAKCKKVSCLCGETSYAKLKETEYRMTANHFQSQKLIKDRARRAVSSSTICKPRLSSSLYRPYKPHSKQSSPFSNISDNNFLYIMDDRKPESVTNSFSIPRLRNTQNEVFSIENAGSTKEKILRIGREYIRKYYNDSWSMKLIETLCSCILKLRQHRNQNTQNYNDKLNIIADFLEEHQDELEIQRRLLRDVTPSTADKRKMIYLERFRYLLFAMNKDMMV